MLGALLFLKPGTGKPLDGEILCSRFSLVTVVPDSLSKPFVAPGEVIKDALDEGSLLLPEAWVLGALLFLGPGTGKPLDGEILCSRFSLVTVVPDSLSKPFDAPGGVIKDALDEGSLLLPEAWVLGALLLLGPGTGKPLDGEILCSRFSLVTVVPDSLSKPFVAPGGVIKDALDEGSLLLPEAWVLGGLLLLGPGTGKPLDGEILCSRFSLVTVVPDSLSKPFIAPGEVIKDALDEGSLLLPEAWVLGALLFLGPATGKPLDGETLCSRFSLVTVVPDSLSKPFVAPGKVIKDALDEGSLLLPEAWVLGAFLFLGPGTGKPLDGETLCSRFSLVTVVADSLFEPFVASAKVIKDSLDESSLPLPDAWVLGALIFVWSCTEQP